jgi:phosphoglycerate dehydrogenase-like enzyme
VSECFQVGVTRDFLKTDGTLAFGDIGLDLFDTAANITWDFLVENTGELHPEQVRGRDALLVLGPRVTAQSLQGADRLIVLARFGVGYDSVDVEACTRAGVLLTITPDGVRRPVATAVMTFLLALSHRLLAKDRLARTGRWHERLEHMGTGLTGRALGLIGLGNIGREVVTLARPFGLRCLARDPFVRRRDAEALGVELLDLEGLLSAADFVAVCCALTPETYHLLDARRLALLKPTAYLINVARGPIVDQKALAEVLRERRIAGAGLDVFEEEPVHAGDPLLNMDNVLLSPHCLSWTDECFRGIGRSACLGILEAAAGRVPLNVVNPEALEHSRLQERLRGQDRRR